MEMKSVALEFEPRALVSSSETMQPQSLSQLMNNKECTTVHVSVLVCIHLCVCVCVSSLPLIACGIVVITSL